MEMTEVCFPPTVLPTEEEVSKCRDNNAAWLLNTSDPTSDHDLRLGESHRAMKHPLAENGIRINVFRRPLIGNRIISVNIVETYWQHYRYQLCREWSYCK